MDPDLLVRGFVIGLAVAAALGPVGLLVIRRTIEHGFLHGLVSGLGVATADAAYGALAAFGLTAVTEVLLGVDRALGIAGGAVLLVLAARALRPADAPVAAAADPAAGRRPDGAPGPLAAWGSMVALTLTNPATILSFAALFASIGAGTGGPAGAATVTAGVFLGSAAWWVVLTGATTAVRSRIPGWAIRLLNVASALVIGGFGVVAVVYGIAGS